MKTKRLALLLAVLLIISSFGFILSGCEESKAVSSKADVSSKLDEFMTAYNEYCSNKYNGAILVAKGDEILLSKGYGMASFEDSIPNTPDTVFQIASVSKSFTAMAIMQLEEKGLLNVNDPISKYVAGNQRGDDITIHMLLNHSSGLQRDGLKSGSRVLTLEENVAFINKGSLQFEPGESYSYSNAGYEMLATIIEKASGISFNDYMKENILTPLGMNNSSMGVDDSYVANQAIGYRFVSGSPQKMHLDNLSWYTGCGSIYSTVEDLNEYGKAICEGKLLTKESYDKMLTAYSKEGYGYGWGISERFGHREINHGGHETGYFSQLTIYPDDGVVIALLSNNNDNTAINELSAVIPAIVFDRDYAIPQKINASATAPEILGKYVGEYKFEEGFSMTVYISNNKLYVKQDNSAVIELLPISDNVFYDKKHEIAHFEFITDKEDSSVSLKIVYAGMVYVGKR